MQMLVMCEGAALRVCVCGCGCGKNAKWPSNAGATAAASRGLAIWTVWLTAADIFAMPNDGFRCQHN